MLRDYVYCGSTTASQCDNNGWLNASYSRFKAGKQVILSRLSQCNTSSVGITGGNPSRDRVNMSNEVRGAFLFYKKEKKKRKKKEINVKSIEMENAFQYITK